MLMCAGFTALGLSIPGFVVPGWPRTPFILLAAFCFSGSSQRMNKWLRRNRFFGPYLENFYTKCGVPVWYKILNIALLWGGLAVSMYFIQVWFVRYLILPAVGIGVTTHLLLLKTKSKTSKSIPDTQEN